ncbi:unnamed protein product, partial [Dicrocoelium dendriticum]
MIKEVKAPQIFRPKEPSFTTIEQNGPHCGLVYTAFQTEGNSLLSPKMTQVQEGSSGLCSARAHVSFHAPIIADAAAKISEMINYLEFLVSKRQGVIKWLVVLHSNTLHLEDAKRIPNNGTTLDRLFRVDWAAPTSSKSKTISS